MTTLTAKRAILQFDGLQEYNGQLISRTFRRDHASEASDDYYEQLIPRQEEDWPEQHIILDLHCRANPSADITEIPHEVFRAFRSSEADEFQFEPIQGSTMRRTIRWCIAMNWPWGKPDPLPIGPYRILLSRNPRAWSEWIYPSDECHWAAAAPDQPRFGASVD